MASNAQDGSGQSVQDLGDGWERDTSETVPTGMDVVAELQDGTTVEGTLVAIWTHEGEPAKIEIEDRDDESPLAEFPLVVPQDRVEVGGTSPK